MGNESSVLKDCSIDETPILKYGTDFSLHHAQRLEDKSQLSVFISKDEVGHKKNRLMGKNLKLYRHPFILRYVDFCESHDSSIYLFTEKASPLSVVLKQQSFLQICLGLQNIIQALEFLHEVGLACHNNVSQQAILVTPEGRWKLGGMEFVTKFDCMSQAFLESTHSYRYERGISPEEKSSSAFKDHRKRDIYSLGVLIEEVLTSHLSESSKSEDEDVKTDTKAFLDFTTKKLQSVASDVRPSLKDILGHAFFQKDYLNIVAFLTDLPLKSSSERKEFFISLTEKLFSLPERVVSAQLSSLLLSRLVLLDKTAADVFLPNMLTPSKGNRGFFSLDKTVNPILSERFFQDDVIPILLKIFLVRDVQIRSVLLRHFSGYCHLFHQVLLEEEVLPQLLLGIRDSNDSLVANSLRALADLVPILGASRVIGNNRRKVFSNGYPGKIVPSSESNDEKSENRRMEIQQKREERRFQMELKRKEKERSASPERSQSPDTILNLSQRHSPIGAESESGQDVAETIVDEKTAFDDNDEWDNWDIGSRPQSPEIFVEIENIDQKFSIDTNGRISESVSSSSNKPAPKRVLDMDDISRLDIKTSGMKNVEKSGDDFFADMAPVISETPKVAPSTISKFDVLLSTNEPEGDGWEGDGWE